MTLLTEESLDIRQYTIRCVCVPVSLFNSVFLFVCFLKKK